MRHWAPGNPEVESCCQRLGFRVVLMWVLVFGLGLVISGNGRNAWAQEDEEVETERTPTTQPLNELDAPWYDPERAEIRPVTLDPLGQGDASSRDSDWIDQPRAPATPTAPTTGSGTSAFGAFLTQAFSVLIWILISVVVIALIAVVIWVLMRSESKSQNSKKERRRQILDLDNTRVELLPFDVNASQGDLLEQARAARAAGELRRAIVLLFAYMLLKLERHGWLFLARGKTNRNYLRELRATPGLHGVVEGVIVTFEDAFFGDLEPDSAEFDRCWKELDDFHRIVEAKSP